MIKFVCFDFDGVFTNGEVSFDGSKITKKYNVKDGTAIKMLRNNNIKVGVISAYVENESTRKICQHLKIDYVSVGSGNKIEILNKWLEELNITIDEVAYIGDDLSDIQVLEKVKISGCPNDAVEKVKSICQYKCKKNGGRGCVREFVEFVLANNNKNNIVEISEETIEKRKNGKVTAIIPVRSGSTRCKNKNMRPFGDVNTNLIELKINTLKRCKNIDYIIVSSNDDEMLRVAKENGAIPHKREQKFCTSDCPGSEVHYQLARAVKSELIMYTHCVAPFVKSETFDNMIELFRKTNYDTICAGNLLKEFIWFNNKSVNFDSRNAPPSQFLPDYVVAQAGCACLSFTSDVIENRYMVGKNPYFYILDQIESIDIDTNFDFVVAELLYKNGFFYEKYVNDFMKRDNNISVLDCTIRDGGFVKRWNFTVEHVKKLLNLSSNTGINYFEIGYLKDLEYVEERDGIWRCINNNYDIINNLIEEVKPKCKISAMIDCWEFSIENLLPRNKTNLDLIRVCTKKENLVEALDMCRKIKNMEYEVSLNIIYCSHLSDLDMDNIVNVIEKDFLENGEYLDYICFADSMGATGSLHIKKIINKFRNSGIKVGIHLHNNEGSSLSNIISSVDGKVDMIDGTYEGIGKNGGNANLEFIILYLQLKHKHNFNIKVLLEFMDNNFSNTAVNNIKSFLLKLSNVHYSKVNNNLQTYEFYKNIETIKNKLP